MSLLGDIAGDSSLGDYFSTAGGWLSSFDQPRGSETVTSNALQSMTPVDTNANGGGWGTWFQSAFSNVLGYAVQRDAAKLGYEAQQQTNAQKTAQAYMQTRQQTGLNGLMPLLLVGGVIFLAVKAAK